MGPHLSDLCGEVPLPTLCRARCIGMSTWGDSGCPPAWALLRWLLDTGTQWSRRDLLWWSRSTSWSSPGLSSPFQCGRLCPGQQDWAPALRLCMQNAVHGVLNGPPWSHIIFCPFQKIIVQLMDFQARRDHRDQPGWPPAFHSPLPWQKTRRLWSGWNIFF